MICLPSATAGGGPIGRINTDRGTPDGSDAERGPTR
jgi:hypothetical protein